MLKEHNEPAVHVSNLRLKFPGEASFILKDLSFAVPQGQKVLLLGPSGCGKSTLLQVLSGIIPHSVEVPLKYDKIQLPASWGFIFQDPDTQFGLPFVDEELAFVLENLQVPRERMEKDMRGVLERVGLQLNDLHMPIQSLSQGMKQRLALASVLLLDPDVLFLDEPSALLDPEGTVQIWDTVKEIGADRTLIIVEHKIEQIVNWVDRVVLFNDKGEIVADGSAVHIFHNHHDKLLEYGIWYPSVWEDYTRSSTYRHMKDGRQSSRMHAKGQTEELLKLNDFTGYHQDMAKITIPHAIVHTGDWITIVGENGAGKSTLLLSLMQLLRTTGAYRIQGEEVGQQKSRRWFTRLRSIRKEASSSKLGFVFQNPEMQFITNSIYEELAHSLRQSKVPAERIDQEVTTMLKKFDLHMNDERHPYQLSIGQKRRLSVATAIVNEQLILLLDEPTFGQDAKNTMIILEMLERLRSRGIAIVMVTHDPHIVEHFATEVWTVEKGVLATATIAAPANTQTSTGRSSRFTFAPDKLTWAHRVNPALKFTIFLVLLLIVLFNRNLDLAWNQMIGSFLILFLCSGYRWRRLGLFLTPFLFMFISSSSTMILFGKGEHVWWQWGLIRISEESFHSGLLIGFKTLTFGLLGMFFTLTSKPILLFYSLMQQFHLPPKYGYSFIASIRLLPAVWEEIWIRSNALRVRGVRYARGIKGLYERFSLYAVPMLAQSIRRAQRVAIAMEAKRFQIKASRTYYYVTTYSSVDFVFIIVMVCFVWFSWLVAQ
ncbi:ATP-binding cassette domain-containing protein [Paenibacillus sp. KN14-4R]|uniref:ATP-binding cassette domain-containing protein n=1 Tax=Paenibacillus sp. KN14-4R TaxID=3445773 RepID=UPI003FA0A40C